LGSGGARLRDFQSIGLRMRREKRGGETSAKAGGVVVGKAGHGPERLRRPECAAGESRQRGSLGGIVVGCHAAGALVLRSHALDQHPVGFLVTMGAAHGQSGRRLGFRRSRGGGGRQGLLLRFGRGRQRRARLRDAGAAVAVGEQSVVAVRSGGF